VKHHPEKLIRLVDLPREQDPERIGLLIRSANAAQDDDTPAVQWRIRNTLHNRLQGRRRVHRGIDDPMIFDALPGKRLADPADIERRHTSSRHLMPPRQ